MFRLMFTAETFTPKIRTCALSANANLKYEITTTTTHNLYPHVSQCVQQFTTTTGRLLVVERRTGTHCSGDEFSTKTPWMYRLYRRRPYGGWDRSPNPISPCQPRAMKSHTLCCQQHLSPGLVLVLERCLGAPSF